MHNTHWGIGQLTSCIVPITKGRSITQPTAGHGRFSATCVSPTALNRCLFGPSLSCSFQCHVHFAIVYIPSTSGISRASSLHCFICMPLVYLYPRDVHRRVWLCTSDSPYICHIPVACWRSVSSIPAGVIHWCFTWCQEYWPFHARCQ